jgi:hypothetical protein
VVISFQAFLVWLVSLTQAGKIGYGEIWRTVFWTYVIPLALRGVLSNLILLLSGGPTRVSFGLGLLVPVPVWVDRLTDLFALGQLYLFFAYFRPEGGLDRKQRWWVTAGLALGTVLAGFLV